MALAGKITLAVALRETNAVDLGTAAYEPTLLYEWVLATGVGLGQADRVWVDAGRSLAASGTENLDLAGALVTAFGGTLTIVKIKGLFIKTADANPGTLALSRPATNGVVLFSAASDAIVIPAGGFFGWACKDNAAVAVTAATGDLLTVTAAATSGTYFYDVVVVGTSA